MGFLFSEFTMKNKMALFSLGFRPFFLIATVFSSLLILAWVAVYWMGVQWPAFNYYPMVIWHAHEMVFGYAMAVVAGFLLTAIRNWTGVATIDGVKLMLLVTVWILGRIAPFIFQSPALIAICDLLFLPLLAVAIAIPLIKAGNKRNYFMIGMVVLLAVLNLLVHLQLLGALNNTAVLAYKTAFFIIIALIIVMAGRVFPMFSQNGVAQRYQVKKYQRIEQLAMPSYFAFVLAFLYTQLNWLIVTLALFAAVVHAVRLFAWYNRQIWQVPLVWVLHIGYGFLVVGLLLCGISVYQPAWYFMALHSLSIGTLGIITIGMMSRVSVGHTGRDLRHPPRLVQPIFLLLVAAVMVRSLLPLFIDGIYQTCIIVSGLLWALAFLLFVISYALILIKPRADTK